MKIGCCTGMENYGELCELGYDFIELAGGWVMKMSEEELENAQKLISKNKIPCNGFNAYCGEDLHMAGPQFDLQAARDYAAEISRRGTILGIKVIGLGAPLARRIPEDFDCPAAVKQLKEFIRVSAEEGAKHGIVFLFEALNSYICNLITQTRDALEIVRELNLPNLGMVLDFHHVGRSGEDVSDIAYVMPYVKHLHIDHTVEDGRYHLKEEGRPFYSRCMAAVRASGYDGTLSIEPTVTKGPFREEAQESLRILRSLL